MECAEESERRYRVLVLVVYQPAGDGSICEAIVGVIGD